MSGISKELSSIDFQSMIGGPLTAVIQAQAQAALSTVDFIKSVGFNTDNTPVMVDFKYNKFLPNMTNTGFEPQIFTLSVPILSIVNIPCVVINYFDLQFNAKINSIQETVNASSSNLSSSLSVTAGCKPVSAKLSCSYSSKKSTSSTDKTERTYSLSIHVSAVQADLPEGLERILNILENSITDTPPVIT